MTEKRPSSPVHAIAVTIEPGWIRATFTCAAEVGADCRLTCPEQCEEWEPDHHHTLVDYGRCVQTEWLENGDWQEDYQGGEVPLVSGPIELEWTGGGYRWTYAPAPKGS